MKFGNKRRTRLISDMTIPADAEATGEIYRSQPVLQEKKPRIITRPVLDENGKEVWMTSETTGMRTKRVMERIQDPDDPWIVREFVLHDMGNGQVRKNYHFRGPKPSDEDMRPEEDKLREEVNTLKRVLANLVEQQGLSVREPTVFPDTEEDVVEEEAEA